jgi:hypothetical protein
MSAQPSDRCADDDPVRTCASALVRRRDRVTQLGTTRPRRAARPRRPGERHVRDQHFGEGRYEQSERVIQRLLGVEREPVSVEGLGVETAADWDHLYTPETYLDYAREEPSASGNGTAFGERRSYELPERLRLNHWAVAGEWTIGPEHVVLEQAGGSIAYRFHARDAHLVLSPGARKPIRFRVLLDGQAPGPSDGDQATRAEAVQRRATPQRSRLSVAYELIARASASVPAYCLGWRPSTR